MSIKLDITVDYDKLIEIINYLDQSHIQVIYDIEKVYGDIVQEKRFDLIDFFVDRGETPIDLLNYCYEDDVDVIRFLMDRFEETGGNLSDFLMSALEIGLFEIVLDITTELVADSNVNPTELIDSQIINKACELGNKDAVQLLLDKGFKISNCTIEPLNDALQNNRADLIPLLLSNGSDIRAIKSDTLTICMIKKNRLMLEMIQEWILQKKLVFDSEDTVSCISVAIERDFNGLAINLFNNGPILNSEQLTRLIANAKSNKCDHLALAFQRILSKKIDKQ
jgi:hypothetical protein